MDRFRDLEKVLGKAMFKDPKLKSEAEEKPTTDIKDLEKAIHRGVSRPTDDDRREWAVDLLGIERKILDCEAMWSFSARFEKLSKSLDMCSLSLSVFPMKSIILKRPLIHWWITEGFVQKNSDVTAAQMGENAFEGLIYNGLITPSSKNNFGTVKSFIINPWIHRMLIMRAKKNLFAEFSSRGTPCTGRRRVFLCRHNEEVTEAEDDVSHVTMVFNVDRQYLRMKPQWLSKMRKVEFLHMGRWQNSVTHHIEVEDQTLFNALGSQKHLRYLSLSGISRIETLPASISKLISLQILDLRACHNLEKLPHTISRLKNLTHLDVSQCFLLESMPKGLEQLHNLLVLKGFVIGKAENSCKISDLSQLKNLGKLSIRVGGAQLDDQLGGLDILHSLRVLTISWGNVSSAQGTAVSLPPNLAKLDLRCVPFETVPDWLVDRITPLSDRWVDRIRPWSNLDRLYIKGGKLKSLKIPGGQVWEVRCLRFKYLVHLNLTQEAPKNYKRLDTYCYELVRP